jgi:hypothetical protein
MSVTVPNSENTGRKSSALVRKFKFRTCPTKKKQKNCEQGAQKRINRQKN